VSAVWIVAADAFRAMLADVLRLPPGGVPLSTNVPAVGLPVSEMVWTALQHALANRSTETEIPRIFAPVGTPRLKPVASSFAPTVPGR